MERNEAKRLIIREWDSWAADNLLPNDEAGGTVGLAFFGYLESERPDLLNFRGAGDKWQTVHAWLLEEGKVIN